MIKHRNLPYSQIRMESITLSKNIRLLLKIIRQIKIRIWFIYMPIIKMNSLLILKLPKIKDIMYC